MRLGWADLSRRLPSDPAPEDTLMIRGVLVDFLSSGANASTIMKGPVELVWKHCPHCSSTEDPESEPIAALLTRISSLKSR